MEDKKIILKLLRPRNRKMYSSWIALCSGLLLLFAAVLIWLDFQFILKGKHQQNSMSEYLVIGKTIPNRNEDNIFKPNSFSENDISELRSLKTVEDIGKIKANQFRVSAIVGGVMGFRTELFLEAVDHAFLDDHPENWSWEPGQNNLPVILSNDFLDLYNYGFSLSQGLPQLSRQSIKAIPFQIIIAGGMEKYNAEIVGFTDRINAVLVPESFLEAMNKKYGLQGSRDPARVILKVKDPSDRAFIQLLTEKEYTVNADQLRWDRVKTAVRAIVSAIGIVAIIIVGMSVLSFMLFLEVTIYRAGKSIRLLKQIGYAPQQLRKVLLRTFFPWLGSAVVTAAVIAFIFHLFTMNWLKKMDLDLSVSDAWILVLLLAIFVILLYMLLKQKTRRILRQI